MKKLSLLFASLLLMSSTLFIACDKDDDDDVVVNSGNDPMSGAQEETPTSTGASGTVNVSYNKSTKMLTYTVNWTGLSGPPAAMHFHGPALPGVSAGVLVGVTGFTAAAAGNVTGSFTVTNIGSLLEADLLAGKWYFNIHTALHPAGEIRGQVTF